MSTKADIKTQIGEKRKELVGVGFPEISHRRACYF